MSKFDADKLTAFGKKALELDHDFSELSRLSGQIERLDIETEGNLELSIRLLTQFAKHGQNISEGIQEFSQTLQAARVQSELAASIVAERAALIQKRQDERNALQEKFQQLGVKVQEVSSGLASLKLKEGEPATEEQRAQLPIRLREMDSRLMDFAAEAKSIQQEAHEVRLRKIEREAESLYGTLESARRKVGTTLTSLNH